VVGGWWWVVGVGCGMWYVGELHWSKGEVCVGAWCVKCEVCVGWWAVGGVWWVVVVVCGMLYVGELHLSKGGVGVWVCGCVGVWVCGVWSVRYVVCVVVVSVAENGDW